MKGVFKKAIHGACVFALVGPPIGALQAAALLWADNRAQQLGAGGGFVALCADVGVLFVFSYLFGLLPALMVGFATGAALTFCRSLTAMLLASIGALALLATLVAALVPEVDHRFFLDIALFCLLPTCVGTLALWRVYQRRQRTADAASLPLPETGDF